MSSETVGWLTVGVLFAALILWITWIAARDPGQCFEELRVPQPGFLDLYRIHVCGRRKGHEDDHRDYKDDVGWPQ